MQLIRQLEPQQSNKVKKKTTFECNVETTKMR